MILMRLNRFNFILMHEFECGTHVLSARNHEEMLTSAAAMLRNEMRSN